MIMPNIVQKNYLNDISNYLHESYIYLKVKNLKTAYFILSTSGYAMKFLNA